MIFARRASDSFHSAAGPALKSSATSPCSTRSRRSNSRSAGSAAQSFSSSPASKDEASPSTQAVIRASSASSPTVFSGLSVSSFILFLVS